MNCQSILIVDDDIEILNIIDVYLKNEGYNVFKACDGQQCLDILAKEIIHLVVLDIMMPKMDGLMVCSHIRKDLDIPIILLSAKDTDMDKIMGLGIGADDYLTKPFNPMELIARIKSQLRRYLYLNKSQVKDGNQNIVNISGLIINKDNYVVTLYGREIALSPTEYQILLLLAENCGKVLSSEEIFEKVWREKFLDSNNTVMVHIWRIREKIEDNPKEPKIIKTVWGVGYKIER